MYAIRNTISNKCLFFFIFYSIFCRQFRFIRPFSFRPYYYYYYRNWIGFASFFFLWFKFLPFRPWSGLCLQWIYFILHVFVLFALFVSFCIELRFCRYFSPWIHMQWEENWGIYFVYRLQTDYWWGISVSGASCTGVWVYFWLVCVQRPLNKIKPNKLIEILKAPQKLIMIRCDFNAEKVILIHYYTDTKRGQHTMYVNVSHFYTINLYLHYFLRARNA